MSTATWKCIAVDERLRRSSHVVSAIGSDVFVFGGELVARQPRDNEVFRISGGNPTPVVIQVKSEPPSPRVGSASTAIKDKIYLFSGRGGVAMAPIEEKGGLYEYDTTTSVWCVISPKESLKPYPPARSYHCMTSDGQKKLYLHAGCPEKGRLADLWCFDTAERVWTELASAPSPQRGGASIAYSDDKLYRMNGFDGNTEQGGKLDIYDISSNSWSTQTFPADGKVGPEARSVSALLVLDLEGRKTLITLFGEHDPSSLGHAGAGKMLGNVWLLDLASFQWQRVDTQGSERPASRGWFDADVINDNNVVVVGGLSEGNSRLDDAWVLSF